ncbi:MAG: nucleotidyltransferase family protein [Armatimonas sp.]
MRSGSLAVGAVLLAAGQSSRFGQPKQLLMLGGESLLRRAAKIALEAGCNPVAVVLGSEAERMWQEVADLPVEIVVNLHWESGMASSVRAGLQGLLASHAPPGSTFLLICDQPYLTADVLRTLAKTRAFKDKSAAVSVYESGVMGPPCLFSAELFPNLLSMKGEQGAKRMIARLSLDEVACVPFPAGEWDIDTLEDWERLTEEIAAEVSAPEA